MGTARFVSTDSTASLTLRHGRQRRNSRLISMGVLLRKHLRQVVSRFIFSRSKMHLTSIRHTHRFHRMNSIRPVERQLHQLRPRNYLMQYTIIRNMLTRYFDISIRQIKRHRTAKLRAINSNSLRTIRQRSNNTKLVNGSYIARTILNVNHRKRGPRRPLFVLFMRFTRHISKLAMLVRINGQDARRPVKC